MPGFTAHRDDVVARIKAEHAEVEVASFVCDVSKPEEVQAAVDACAKAFDRIDVCIASAWLSHPSAG
jgi:NAD(P)-dependent dehydrogenase (short-subunit alcohol dehydrogenase family)